MLLLIVLCVAFLVSVSGKAFANCVNFMDMILQKNYLKRLDNAFNFRSWIIVTVCLNSFLVSFVRLKRKKEIKPCDFPLPFFFSFFFFFFFFFFLFLFFFFFFFFFLFIVFFLFSFPFSFSFVFLFYSFFFFSFFFYLLSFFSF